MSYIDDNIKQRLLALPVEEVAEALGIRVTRHHALCFMHDDHHPSLVFNPRTNRWKCYVCDVWGNNIDLVQRHQGLSFVDACHWLARQFGILIDGQTVTAPVTVKRPQPPKRVVEQPVIDTEMLQALVDSLSLTDKARQFLFDERQYAPEVVQQLHLCSADSDREILDVLFSKFPEERILRSGLAWQSKGVWRTYFNTPCLFFPYYDQQGQLVTLQARYLGNTDEHQRFQFPRGSKTMVFNLPQLNRLVNGEPLFISEGVTDCIALLSTGKCAVAIPSATTLKSQELEEIVHHPLAMYPDQDEPGERLYQKLLSLVEAHQGSIHRLQLPEGCKDYSVFYRQLVQKDAFTNNLLYQRLRQVRWQLARQYHVPVFLVCHNRTLQELVELRPTTRQALRCVYGMGPKTIERYGDAFLEALQS